MTARDAVAVAAGVDTVASVVVIGAVVGSVANDEVAARVGGEVDVVVSRAVLVPMPVPVPIPLRPLPLRKANPNLAGSEKYCPCFGVRVV